ncbi:MAG: hypothetical protein ABI759_31195 [Candidatus Solibacter sp.]
MLERTANYAWIEQVLAGRSYESLDNQQRGAVRTLLRHGSGLSMPQITRLIRRYRQSGHVALPCEARRTFPVKYAAGDVELLVEVDRAHHCLSGPATRRILQREWQVFGKIQFARLAEISVAHLYNLRNSDVYLERMGQVPPLAAGESPTRRQLPLKRTPGWIRVSALHQSNLGAGTVYRISAVDATTQWEVVACAPAIDELSALRVLDTLQQQFPFRLLAFHSPNGGEAVDSKLATLLNQLSASPRNLSRTCSAAPRGEILQRFYDAHLNPYLNYHRPCGFAQIRADDRGLRSRYYSEEDYLTPYEKLRSLAAAQHPLCGGVPWEHLDRIAYAHSDTEAARLMNSAKAALFQQVN